MKKDSDLLIVADGKPELDQAYTMAKRELANQAALASRFTGLSLTFCTKMVMHKFYKRLAQ